MPVPLGGSEVPDGEGPDSRDCRPAPAASANGGLYWIAFPIFLTDDSIRFNNYSNNDTTFPQNDTTLLYCTSKVKEGDGLFAVEIRRDW